MQFERINGWWSCKGGGREEDGTDPVTANCERRPGASRSCFTRFTVGGCASQPLGGRENVIGHLHKKQLVFKVKGRSVQRNTQIRG